MKRRRNKNRGHPTFFNGITFRSRLEARVAALFYILGPGWDYTYEPDIGLSFYIPDFFLSSMEILAEVKPITKFDSVTVTEAITKIVSSGYDGESMLIGAIPRLDKNGRVVFGLLGSGHVMLPFHLTRDEGIWIPCTCAEGCVSSVYERTNQLWAKHAFAEAGNNVMWKAPKGIGTK